MLKLGFLASHAGSNMQAVVAACRAGTLVAEPRAAVSNNSRSGALAKARAEGIAAYHISEKTHPGAVDAAIAAVLARHGVEVVCLAGYMKRLGPALFEAYAGRILNIHPSLLPKYGGQGMYGLKVHEAVLAAGESASGATIHLVEDSGYDQGRILAQEVVAVAAGDTPEALQARVLAVEHRLYAATLARIAQGEVALS
jgi:phosphoribosylglycinamide formyltransferase-1